MISLSNYDSVEGTSVEMNLPTSERMSCWHCFGDSIMEGYAMGSTVDLASLAYMRDPISDTYLHNHAPPILGTNH